MRDHDGFFILSRLSRFTGGTLVKSGIFLLGLVFPTAGGGQVPGSDGKQLYLGACAACHGPDGTGAAASRVAFAEALPDFTSCTFASREPDADWATIVSHGGPVRGFSRMMPAFGSALTPEQIEQILGYIRTMCTSGAWPRGELNLPRPLVTEKAYPEDEAVFAASANAQGAGAVMSEVVYERRLGARNQIELVVPFGWRQQTGTPGSGSSLGLGDIAIGFKRAMLHNLKNGTILSLTSEIKLPTGSEGNGFGAGTVVFEPFVTVGQILPSDGFLQFQVGVEIPTERTGRDDEAFWRGVIGTTFTQGGFGRTWSPMVEILGSQDLAPGSRPTWDVIPQIQVSLNTRQHVLANVGVRLPVSDGSTRASQLLFYVIWDWFDGGFLAGW